MKTNLMRDSLNALFSIKRTHFPHIARFYLFASAIFSLLAIYLESKGVEGKIIVIGIVILALPLNALIYALFQKRDGAASLPHVMQPHYPRIRLTRKSLNSENELPKEEPEAVISATVGKLR